MITMYAVLGSTGMYSDHTQWLVCVYPEEEQARKHVALANEAVKDLKRQISRLEDQTNLTWEQEEAERERLMKEFPFDKDVKIGCYDVVYGFAPVPFVRHADEYQELPRIF